MVNNFSFDQVSLCKNWTNTSLFIIKVALFYDVILVPNYHGCKGQAINLRQMIAI